MQTELPGHSRRFLAIFILLAGLAALFVWAGTVTPDPAMNNYPENDEFGSDPEAYVGKQVEIHGTVVATDPVVDEPLVV